MNNEPQKIEVGHREVCQNTLRDPIPANVQRLLAVPRGRIVRINTLRPMKMRKTAKSTGKAINMVLFKSSTFSVRVGVDYENIASVKDKTEAGEREANGALPWGEWAVFPYLIAHKGAFYLRCTKVPGAYASSVIYAQVSEQMVECSREEAEDLCLASEFADREDSPVFNIKVDTITQTSEDIREMEAEA